MAKKLSEAEIKRRLRQLRNVTMLHARAIAKVAKLEALLKARDELLLQKDARIAELETKLLDKEAQRKELAAKLFKAKKDRAKAAITRDLAEASGAPRRNPGAQPGPIFDTKPQNSPF